MDCFFWAKTNTDGQPGISVYAHMINVGCVAQCFAEKVPGLLKKFHIQATEVGALASLHDLGKITPGFQGKCDVWIEENGLAIIVRNGCWDTGMEADHGKVSHSAIQDFLLAQGVSGNCAMYLAAVLGGASWQNKVFSKSPGYKTACY